MKNTENIFAIYMIEKTLDIWFIMIPTHQQEKDILKNAQWETVSHRREKESIKQR